MADSAAAGRVEPVRLRRRIGLAVMAGLAFAAADLLYVNALQAQGGSPDSAYVPVAIELMLAGLAVSALGGGMAPNRHIRTLLLSAAAVGGAGLGFLAMFSIGALVLVGAVLCAVAYATTAPTRPVAGAVLATAAGAVTALAALGAVFAPQLSAHVTCTPHGAMYSSGMSLGGGSINGTGGTDAGGSASGGMSEGAGGNTVTGSGVDNGVRYHFTCRDGRLVEFTRGR